MNPATPTYSVAGQVRRLDYLGVCSAPGSRVPERTERSLADAFDAAVAPRPGTEARTYAD